MIPRALKKKKKEYPRDILILEISCNTRDEKYNYLQIISNIYYINLNVFGEHTINVKQTLILATPKVKGKS